MHEHSFLKTIKVIASEDIPEGTLVMLNENKEIVPVPGGFVVQPTLKPVAIITGLDEPEEKMATVNVDAIRLKLELYLLNRTIGAFSKIQKNLTKRATKLGNIISREEDALAAERAALVARERAVAATVQTLSSEKARAERVAARVAEFTA